MRHRIRTTRQAREARARAIWDQETIAAVREGRLTHFERTRTLPSGTELTQCWTYVR